MKNRFLNKAILALAIATSALIGCSDDENPTPLPGQEGFFVVNEGAFNNGDASLSFFDKKTNTIVNDVFLNNIGRPLGDQGQSMTVFNDRGYIVVQNSGKIEVIDPLDISSVGTVTSEEGIISPRYLIGLNEDKAFVSDWGADGLTGTVKILDLNTLKITKTIQTGAGANEMVIVGDKLYVANSGGYGSDNTVSVIDTQSAEVVNNIIVGDNPASLVVDGNGHIWVAGNGKLVYNSDWSVNQEASTPGFLAKIANDHVALKLDASEIASGPQNLEINNAGTELYYSYSGAIYKLGVTATEMATTVFIDKDFYSMSVDPSTDDIIGGEAPNFSSAGTIYRYSSSGELLDDHTSGIAPKHFAFK